MSKRKASKILVRPERVSSGEDPVPGWREADGAGATAKLQLASPAFYSCGTYTVSNSPPGPQTPPVEVKRASKNCPLDCPQGEWEEPAYCPGVRARLNPHLLISGYSRSWVHRGQEAHRNRTVARYELTITIRVSLDRRVHLLNVLWSHPPSISQASLGQDLKHKMVPQWGGASDGGPPEHSQPPSSCCKG